MYEYLWEALHRYETQRSDQRGQLLYHLDKQCLVKAEGFELGVVNGKELTRFIYTDVLVLDSVSLVIRMSSNLDKESSFHMGDLLPAFRGTEESQNVFLALVVS